MNHGGLLWWWGVTVLRNENWKCDFSLPKKKRLTYCKTGEGNCTGAILPLFLLSTPAVIAVIDYIVSFARSPLVVKARRFKKMDTPSCPEGYVPSLRGSWTAVLCFTAATSVVSESAALASLTAAIYNATHQSVTTAENQPLLGQYTHIEKIKQNPAVYVNPYQPLTVVSHYSKLCIW